MKLEDQFNPELKDWLSNFEQKKGRKLKVLHVGNIAANGFLNAKFQRQVGIEADVLCNDYYHIMGYPEWEEMEIKDDYKQDVLPRFSKRDRKKYVRPKWFVQGPFSVCVDYLDARNSGDKVAEEKTGKALNSFLYNSILSKFIYPKILRVQIKHYIYQKYLFCRKMGSRVWSVADTLLFQHSSLFDKGSKKIKRKLKTFLNGIISRLRVESFQINNPNYSSLSVNLQCFANHLNQKYLKAFTERSYRFKENDLVHYCYYRYGWIKLFSHYDVIQCYGTDPIYALLHANKAYVAFEHGTLRTFTSDDSSLNALTALAYRNASHVFITNADCLEYAQKLNIKNYSAMIHPIDVAQHRTKNTVKVKKLRAFYKADVLLFCPLRHDWEIKGTDKHIRALPIINNLIPGKVVLIVTNWGADLEKSRELAKSLGVMKQIVWVPPLCRVRMIEMIQASDVVLDQTILPCFGSTAPQALACGIPTIMSYKAEVSDWLFDEPAPLISASNETEIAKGIQLALNKDWLENFKLKARNWVDKYHSPSVALNQQIQVYRSILEGKK